MTYYNEGCNVCIKMQNLDRGSLGMSFRTVDQETWNEITQAEWSEMCCYNRSYTFECSSSHLDAMVDGAKQRIADRKQRQWEQEQNELRLRREAEEAAREKIRMQREAEQRRAALKREEEEHAAARELEIRRAEQMRRDADAERLRIERQAAEQKRAEKEYYSTQFTAWAGLSRSDFRRKLSTIPRPRRSTPRAIIIGRTNAGKTTLINTLFGLNLPTAAIENTMGKRVVFHAGGVEVVDTFGYNDGRSYYTAEMAEFFLSVDRVVLAYAEAGIENEIDVLKLISAARCEVAVVHSKCETLSPEDIEKIKEHDLKEIKAHDDAIFAGVRSLNWLAVSSKSNLGVDKLRTWVSSTRVVR